ncbi:MAG: tRNA guanosine(34) transglycosylase Tgt [Phycisphaerae bacterium]|jgi:queuine tRNA-ribosyltransferase
MFSFNILARDGKARLGKLATDHGEVDTPVFMPVGTAGSVKGVCPDQLRAAGVQMILGNTYHLMLRPGPQTVEALGGLHRIMAWNGPILTDSGGFQVFSLAHLRKIDDQGVVFQSHIDGAQVALTPQRAIAIQRSLGGDVMMQLDECPPANAEKDQVAQAVARSAAWAGLCSQEWRRSPQTPFGHGQVLFGIQQGGVHVDLRARSAAALAELDLPGYAIGGLSVGEGHDAMCGVLEHIDGQLPDAKPRYLMGVGEPRDILAAVACGVDMFDCVMPTRNGRNAQAFTWGGKLHLRNAKYTTDPAPLEESCDCFACRNYSRGTIRHLFMAKEMLGPTLVSIHNLHFLACFTAAIRAAIAEGSLAQSAAGWNQRFYAAAEEGEE